MDASAPELSMIRAYLKYTPVMTLLLGLTGLLQLATANSADRMYYFAAALAGVLGIIHVLMLYGFFKLRSTAFVKQCCILTATIILVSAIIAATVFTLFKLDLNFLGYLAAFAIPFLLSLGYSYYLQIPEQFKTYWYHPMSSRPAPFQFDQTETRLIKFVLSKSAGSSAKTSFTLDAPVNLPVSEIFMNLINEHNKSHPDKPIEYYNENNQPTGWLFFFREGILMKKYFIDPAVSPQDNHIPSGRIIQAARAMQTED
jgi:hypothetical protein